MYTKGDLVLVDYGSQGFKYSGEYEGKVSAVGPRSLRVLFPDSNTECTIHLNQQHLVKKKLQKKSRAKASKLEKLLEKAGTFGKPDKVHD